MEYTFSYQSPIGVIRIVINDEKLARLDFGDTPVIPVPGEGLPTPVSEMVRLWLTDYFAGKNPDFRDLPILRVGTPFQERVWDAMAEIPYGNVATYGEIAASIGSGARAVGGAVARNPFCIVGPCHRVVRADSQLGGYAWGPQRKLWLLRHEGYKDFLKSSKGDLQGRFILANKGCTPDRD